jgi:hypothetical protein
MKFFEGGPFAKKPPGPEAGPQSPEK